MDSAFLCEAEKVVRAVGAVRAEENGGRLHEGMHEGRGAGGWREAAAREEGAAEAAAADGQGGEEARATSPAASTGRVRQASCAADRMPRHRSGTRPASLPPC